MERSPSSLRYLARESKFHKENAKPSTNFDGIFSDAVKKWVEMEKNAGNERTEPQLTKLLSVKIEEESGNTGFHSDAEVCVDYEYVDASGAAVRAKSRIDILLTPQVKVSKESSTPVAVIEVGRNDLDWWKKLDQNIKYLDKFGIRQKDTRLRFDKPLLCAVLTIEGEATEADLKVKLGVFLCSPKEPTSALNDFRLTLLWHCQHQESGGSFESFRKSATGYV